MTRENGNTYLEKIRILEEEVAFLGNWSFVPGKVPFSYAEDHVTLSCTSDGSQLVAHRLILVSFMLSYYKFCSHPDTNL